MLKIKYTKNCHKHDKVEKVKIQVVKAYKFAKGLSYIYADISLTGIEDIDYQEIKYYYDSEYEKLRDRITKDIEDNKEYNHGFHLSSNIIVLKFLSELNTALSLTGEYPEIPKKIVDYEFISENVEDRYNEAKVFFGGDKFIGLNKEYFSVNGEKETRLYSIIFEKTDLLKVQKIRLKYQ